MVDILNTLNQIPEKTYKEFTRFLKSPYHNSNKQLVKLMIFRSKNLMDLNTINTKILRRENYNEQVLRNLLSALNKKFQQFLIINQLEQEPTLREILLIKKMKSLGMEHQLEKRTPKINDQENTQKSITVLQLEEHLFPDQLEALGMDNNLLVKKKIEREYNSLHERSYISKCNFYCIYLAVKKRHPNFLEIKSIEEDIKHLKIPSPFKGSLLIRLYYQAFSLLRHPTKKKFLNLHNNLFDNLNQLHINYTQFILRVLINYCLSKNNANDPILKLKLYEYLKTLISFTENKIIPFHQIINLVTVGCRLELYDEVSKIIDHHQARIEVNAYTYSKALLNYYNGNFDKVIDLLAHTNFSNLKVNINARSLLISVYLEKKEYQLSLNSIEAFRIYILRSKKILSQLKKGWLNYLRFLKSFSLLEENKNTIKKTAYLKARTALRTKIQHCKVLINRSHLLELLSN